MTDDLKIMITDIHGHQTGHRVFNASYHFISPICQSRFSRSILINTVGIMYCMYVYCRYTYILYIYLRHSRNNVQVHEINCLEVNFNNGMFLVSGRSPHPRRTGALPPLPARTEDLPRVPLLHSDGHDDHPRLLLLLHHDFSRLDVPLKQHHKPREVY